MGNVLACSKPAVALTSEIAIPKEDKITEKEELQNPGTYDDIHRKCKDIMPINFEGAKLLVNKGLSNHFQVSHALHLGSSTQNGYKFGTTYVGSKQLSSSEAFPIILGDIDPSGNMNANIIHQFTPRVKCIFSSKIQNKKVIATHMTSNYMGKDFTTSFAVGNPNVLNNSGLMTAQYLQAITPKLSLGGELAYMAGANIPGGQMALLSGVAKYTNELSTWSGTAGMAGIHVCYYQKASQQLQLGVEIEKDFQVGDSTATFGYQIDIPQSDLTFRGMLDRKWNVAAVLEKRLNPLPFAFTLSGILNHDKTQFKLGCGLVIG